MTNSIANRRHVVTAAILLSLACGTQACKRHKVAVVQTEEESPQLATIVHTADARATAQLLSGFYGVEQNAWRWTAGRFSVVLRPPRNAASKGAILQLNFTIPDAVMARHKAMSLSASVNGTPLAPESYTQAGQFTYSRDVAANLLTGDSVKIDFSLDKTIAPSASDQRELGVIVSTVGFEAK